MARVDSITVGRVFVVNSGLNRETKQPRCKQGRTQLPRHLAISAVFWCRSCLFQLFNGLKITHIKNLTAAAAQHFTGIRVACPPACQFRPAIRTDQIFQVFICWFILIVHDGLSRFYVFGFWCLVFCVWCLVFVLSRLMLTAYGCPQPLLNAKAWCRPPLLRTLQSCITLISLNTRLKCRLFISIGMLLLNPDFSNPIYNPPVYPKCRLFISIGGAKIIIAQFRLK